MKIPDIKYEKLINIPDLISVSLTRFGNTVFLRTNSNHTMIDIDEVDAREWVVKVGDSFHYYEGNKIKRKEETGRDILDFITIDGEINKVRKVGKKVEIAGNIYDLFERKLDRAVFSDKQKLFLSFNNKLHSFDSPLYFILGNSVISLLYEDYNLLFDFISSRKEIFKDGLMHLSIKENVGVDSKGRIYIDDSLVGICKKEYISFIGKLNGNNVLLCGNEIKQYMGGSWYNIGVTNNSDNVKANGELLAFVNDDMLHVFNIDLVEIGKFVDVTGFDISSKEVYILKKNKWYGVLDLFPINEITVLNSNITYSSSLVISYPLLSRIKVTPINGRITSLDLEKCQVHIDPVNFDNKIKLKLDSNFYSFDIEFPVNVEKVSVSLVRPTIVMGPDGFKILKAPRSNSYMKANLKYISSIETKLKIQIGNLEKDIQLEKGKFNEKIIIPLNLDKLDHEVVKLCTDKNFCKEYVIPIKVLDSTGAEINKKIKIRNSFVEIEEDRKLDLFEQHQITARSISVYKSILRARVGDILNLDGKEIKVEPGLRRIFISQENETREFLIEGVETPLLDFSAKIEGNDLVLSTKLSRKAGMEIIYCSDDWRDLVEGNAAIKLNLLPECSNLIVSLYDGDLIWRYNYNLDLTVSSFIKTAYLNSIKIKQHLETFGIL